MANPQQDHHSERMWRFVIQARKLTGEPVSFPKVHKNPAELQLLLEHAAIKKDRDLLSLGRELLREMHFGQAGHAPSFRDVSVSPTKPADPIDSMPDSKTRKLRLGIISAVLVLGLLLIWQLSAPDGLPAGVQEASSQQSPKVTGPLPSEKLFAVHGSNTIGARLMPALVRAWMAERGAQQIQQQSFGVENESLLNAHSQQKIEQVELKAHGSSTGFKSLLSGKAEVAAASRPIKDKEHQALAGFGDMRSTANEHVIAIDGLAIIVHPANPITRLDLNQLKQIFSGEISDWSQLKIPGANTQAMGAGPIQVYARDKNSGTFDTFKSLVLGKKTSLANGSKRFESNDELSDQLARDPSGIGFVALPSVRHARALAISDGGAAILPTRFTLATEDYPLTRRLFLYTRQNAPLEVRSLVELALGSSGQQQVEKVGFVDLRPREATIQAQADWPESYALLTSEARRLSVNFRFKRNTDLLDNKAERDIPRLVRYFSLPENQDKGIYLFGFTDSVGHPDYNLQLSRKRAQAVANRLKQSGLPVILSEGFGDAIPLANNLSPRGRAKNRRVEIWVR